MHAYVVHHMSACWVCEGSLDGAQSEIKRMSWQDPCEVLMAHSQKPNACHVMTPATSEVKNQMNDLTSCQTWHMATSIMRLSRCVSCHDPATSEVKNQTSDLISCQAWHIATSLMRLHSIMQDTCPPCVLAVTSLFSQQTDALTALGRESLRHRMPSLRDGPHVPCGCCGAVGAVGPAAQYFFMSQVGVVHHPLPMYVFLPHTQHTCAHGGM